MLSEIFLFELKYRAKRPATYLYFFIFLLLSFLATATDNVRIGISSEKVLKNAPVFIYNFTIILSVFGALVSSAVMGVPTYRDLEHGTDRYFFALPIKKSAYLGGRFLGSFVTLVFIMLGIYVGILLGAAVAPLFGWVDADKFGPFHVVHYLQPMLLFLLPNLFFLGAVFFSAVTLSRNIMAAYAGGIVLLVGYLIADSLISDLDNVTLSALLDPFGLNAYTDVSKYWSIAEQNNSLVPLAGLVLWNRLIWVGVGVVLLAITFTRFSFQDFLLGRTKRKKKGRKAKTADATQAPVSLESLPRVTPDYSFGVHFRQMFRLAGMEFRSATKDVYFIVILLAGVLFMFLDAWFGNTLYGTPSLPTTSTMIELKEGSFFFFVMILIIFYTGELVHRDRSLKFAQISDTFPVPNWLVYGSKYLALAYICVLLVTTIMVVGILFQTIKGYFHYELDVYFIDLFVLTLPFYLVIVGLAFFVHILVNNKFVGHFAVIAIWVTVLGFRIAEFRHNLYLFGGRPGYLYSEMNGFGHFFAPLLSFNAYWLLLAGVMLLIGNVMWFRGVEENFKNRFQIAQQRFDRPIALTLVLLLVGFVAMGAWIFYNTNVQNEYRTIDEGKQIAADYEKQYKQYEDVPQPKITDVYLEVDLFPAERRADVRGRFRLKNKTNQTIDSLHVQVGKEYGLSNFRIGGAAPETLLDDPRLTYAIYRLPRPLAPGDTTTMQFTMQAQNRGFTNEGYNRELIYNGTFFDTSVLPSFGYSEDREMSSDDDREEYDLPEKDQRAPEIDDPVARNNSFVGDDADYVNFEAVLSTAPDQIAIAPGYLQREWEADGRKYYHYQSEAPGFYYFSIVSARYEVVRDTWTSPDGKTVNLEIYHHPGHERNLDRVMDGMKRSLAYYSKNFGPYQHRQLRILEFPRYSTFAQSFANTVPFSEAFGWQADFSDPEDTDYMFYVTAHEVAHQWWGHQVMPRATKGASTVSETMSQYSALMVMKEKYGEAQMQKFLEYELDSYLRGRAGEDKYEPTILENDGQAYVHYRKGSVAMYALQDFIGEDKLNRALHQYVNSVKFGEAPYTSSRELYAAIQSVTPDSLTYLLTDLWERRALYENRITDAEYEKLSDDRYKVTLTVQTKKYYADSLGAEEETPMNDWVDIGILKDVTEDGQTVKKPLYLQKHRLTGGEHTLEFTVPEKPDRAGVDPFNILLDRNPDDNVTKVSAG
ncbi:Peptidase family M1 [Catalinimonas alkaloidigena]|uniref:Peptidase family M1 n=1 Tax=Catalinimonas alkaloidigena TaxID=1075417 RepID=A0A1G9EFK0_9BACT|nr:M1 family aminopeptidase [Catalinimonas alkaloidigena]SDK74805.1 Peptidase family M1 [Catalinimonas alkaloidigena]